MIMQWGANVMHVPPFWQTVLRQASLTPQLVGLLALGFTTMLLVRGPDRLAEMIRGPVAQNAPANDEPCGYRTAPGARRTQVSLFTPRYMWWCGLYFTCVTTAIAIFVVGSIRAIPWPLVVAQAFLACTPPIPFAVATYCNLRRWLRAQRYLQ